MHPQARNYGLASVPTQFSSPAVASGVVFVGSIGGNVYALNASTGTTLWTYQTIAWLYSSPCVVNGVVYIGSMNGNVYAISDSGRYSTSISVVCSPNPYSSGAPVTCTATILGGTDLTGTVTWTTDSSTGDFNSTQTALISGESTVTYLDSSADWVIITATYSGDANNCPSTYTSYLEPIYVSSSSVHIFFSSPQATFVNSSISCTAVVYGLSPTGNITWSSNSNTGVFNSTQTILENEESRVTYTDQTAGTVTITATYSGDSNNYPSNINTTLTVYPSGNFSLQVSPQNIMDCPGNVINFTATLIDSTNGETWDVSNQANWIVNQNPYSNDGYWRGTLYVPSSTGNFTVTASYLDINNSVSLTVSGSPFSLGPPATFSIDPQYSIITGNNSEAFTATAWDVLGGSWDVSSDVNWSISSGAGGFWSGNTYTSANIGTWTVTASLSGWQATAQLQVANPADLPRMSVVQSGTQNINIAVVNGSQFNVDLRLDNGSGIWGYGVMVDWNNSVLNLVDVNEGSYLTQANSTTLFIAAGPVPEYIGQENISDPFNFNYTLVGESINDFLLNFTSVSGSGVLATLTFQAIGVGTNDIFIESSPDASAVEGIPPNPNEPNLIPFAIVNSTVSVLAPSALPPIDFNHDGKVNFADIQYFVAAYIRYCNGGAMDPACDLNHDGKLNFGDIQLFVHDYVAWAQNK